MTNEGFQIIQGDALAVLKTLESESVQCCVTSPPYFGLRDYGTATWEGGNLECDHKAPQAWAADSGDLGERGHILNANEAKATQRHGVDCRKCGAVRIDAQIGLEAQPDCDLRGTMRLRADLSKDELLFVAKRLLGVENLDGE